MLEKPDIADEIIIAEMQQTYELDIQHIIFLPLGADINTAVYRAESRNASQYFVKLRFGAFEESVVEIPWLLHDQDIKPIIDPVTTRSGNFQTKIDAFTLMVYPFIRGFDGYECKLSASQWIEFGAALNGIHSAAVPETLSTLIPKESYSSYWRNRVTEYQQQFDAGRLGDPIANELTDLMRARRETISSMVQRAEQLGAALQNLPLGYVLCHGDLHPGNILIATQSEQFFIVDWDTLIFAPKERDLMFFGAGSAGFWRTQYAESLFFQGYGPANVEPVALTYYRYERIIEDIAAFCQQILADDEPNSNRNQSLHYLTSQFLPNREVEIAFATDIISP